MGKNKKNKAAMEIERAISKIIEKVTALEGENAPIIIDYLILEKRSDRDLMDLAYGPPESQLRLQLLCDSAKSNLGLPPCGFPPPFSSQSSPRISENRFLMSAAATPSLISGSVSGSYSNLRSSWPFSSSSSSGVDGVWGLTPSGFRPPFSSQSLPRISENRFLVSAAATPSGSVSSRHSNLRSSWPSSSSSSGVDDDVFGLTPSGFPPPLSSPSSSRIWENRFLELAAGTSSLISGSVSSSHSNLSSWPSSSSSYSGVDGVFGLTSSGFPPPLSSPSWSRIWENRLLESAAGTSSLISGTVSGSYSNLSSWPTSSSSSGVDGDFSLWENKDSFRVYVKNGDANLQKSSLGFQETGSSSGSGTKSVQQQEQEEEQIERGNVSSCTKSLQELQIIKEAEKKIETLFSKDDFPPLEDTGKIFALRKGHRHRLDIQNLNRRARQQTAPPPATKNAAPDETHKDESGKEKSIPVDDSCENKEETSGMSESARQETTAPDNLPGSTKNSDDTHQEESEKEKSTPVDDSEENKAETSGVVKKSIE